MKKFLAIIFIFVFCFNSLAQDKENSSPELQQARKLSAEVVSLFNQKNYKEALPLAQKVLAVYEKELDANNIEIARAQRNLGYINYYLNDKKEAQKAFERSLEIYEKQTQLNNAEALQVAGMLETLAVIKYTGNETKTARALVEKILALYEKYGQSDSLKAAQAWSGLGNLMISEQNYFPAAGAYEKSLAIKIKRLGEKDFETIDSFYRCLCALKKAGKENEIERVRLAYFPNSKLTENGTLEQEKREKPAQGKDEEKTNVPNDGKKIVGIPLLTNAGVVNGAALSLPKPAYPSEARRSRAGGTVNVNVIIDEQGKVIFACGAFNKTHSALRQASENAAYGAKFQPTLMDGKPVKVNGVIVYKFVP